jgi:adenine-specific DNA-methyltransferase
MPTLEWLTRDEDLKAAARVPYKLLEADASLSAGDPAAGNMLIQGDNLEALKSLLPYYAGQVKCIYIDPPYNTRSAFEHYDDNLEHSQWLAMIWPRLELLRELLAEDGSIWVSIDDSEEHYLKVVMDEVFGRRNFIASNVWQKRSSRENREAIGDVHEYIVVYSRSPEAFKLRRNKLPLDEQQAKIYRNPDNPKETDPTKRWRGLPMTARYAGNDPVNLIDSTGLDYTTTFGWSACVSTADSPCVPAIAYEGEIVVTGTRGCGVSCQMIDNSIIDVFLFGSLSGGGSGSGGVGGVEGGRTAPGPQSDHCEGPYVTASYGGSLTGGLGTGRSGEPDGVSIGLSVSISRPLNPQNSWNPVAGYEVSISGQIAALYGIGAFIVYGEQYSAGISKSDPNRSPLRIA